MVYQSNAPVPIEPPKRGLSHAIKTMPRWKRKILSFALGIGLIGVAGQAATYIQRGSAPSQPAVPGRVVQPNQHQSAPAPIGGNGFVSDAPATPSPDAGTSPPPTVPSPAPDSSMLQKMTPFMSHVGFSLFVGVVVGLIFRVFLRMALVVTGLIVVAAMSLSYFHVLNIDLTTVRSETAQGVTWLTDQGYRLRDMLFSALPSSTAAGIGFFLGFKRR